MQTQVGGAEYELHGKRDAKGERTSNWMRCRCPRIHKSSPPERLESARAMSRVGKGVNVKSEREGSCSHISCATSEDTIGRKNEKKTLKFRHLLGRLLFYPAQFLSVFLVFVAREGALVSSRRTEKRGTG